MMTLVHTLAVAEYLNFRHAANALGVAQSSVSARVKALEEDLGILLFSTGATYRYYTCSTKARQGKTGCKGRTIPMDKLDHMVADYIGARLLRPQRLETILSSVIDRRQERVERRRAHLAELNRRITETDQRIGRLFVAIEGGMIDKDDAMANLKALRDQATADAERTQLALDSSGSQGVTPDMLKTFACKARERIRLDNGGYQRDHLRALA